jgi:excisionase family DNA binding protein
MEATNPDAPNKSNPDPREDQEHPPPWPEKANPRKEPAKSYKRRRKNRLLKVDAVARRINASESFVYQAIGEGRMRHIRLGKGQGGLRVSEAMLREFLEERTQGGTTDLAPPQSN